jgi:GNAT superfamily N-acetyltransferase
MDAPPLRERIRERLRKVIDVETLLLVAGAATQGHTDDRFRAGRSADLGALLEIYGEGRLRVQRARRRRRLERRFARGDACVVVDDPSGGIAVCMWLTNGGFRLDRYRIPVARYARKQYVYGLRVQPVARGHGLGEAALHFMRAVVAAGGGSEVFSHISPRNPVMPHLVFDKLNDRVVARETVLVVLNRFGIPLRRATARPPSITC